MEARSYNRSRWMAEIRSKGAIGHIGRRRRTGSSLGKIFKNTRGSCRPRRSTPPHFFLGSLFIYLLLFRGRRIFFLPLGRPSAATEGAAKIQDLWGGVRPEKRKKDAHTVDRREMIHSEAKDALGRKEDDGEDRTERRSRSPSSGGNGLRPSLRSQLVASLCL